MIYDINLIYSGKCTFEKDKCGFKDIPGSFKWMRHKGATGSVGTGPNVDHTLGTKLGRQFFSKRIK